VLEEAARRRQESLATLADGELEVRELILDEPISVRGYEGVHQSWVLFGGRKEPLWTSYTAEPDSGSSSFVKATLPVITVHVVEFARPYYSTAQGKKRVDAMAVELGRLRDVDSENVVRIYGVKRDKGPKGWERLFILTENVQEGGKLSKWMPRDGFGEDLAMVGTAPEFKSHAELWQDHVSQVLSGLQEVHRKGGCQKRE
jgi:translation initiation factor 2-alpha kinase 4